MPTDRKPRKPRVDSKTEAVKTMIAASTITIRPPDDMKMSDADLGIFSEIIDEFAVISWTPHTIRIAAVLARTIVDMNSDQEALREEGSVLTNNSGNAMMNPRRTACQSYASMINQLRRSLGLHANATDNKAGIAKKNAIRKGQEADNPLDDDDYGLLNRPDQAPLTASAYVLARGN